MFFFKFNKYTKKYGIWHTPKGKCKKTKTWKCKFVRPSRGDAKVSNRPRTRKSDADEISTIAVIVNTEKKELDPTQDKELDADEDSDNQIVK